MGRGWVAAWREADCCYCRELSECQLLVAFDVRLMSHLLMHDLQRADRIADSVSLTLAVHIVLLVCKNQLRFVSSMTLMTLNPEVM